MKKFFKSMIGAMALAFGHRVEFTNVAEGFFGKGEVTLIADAGTASLYLAVAPGSDSAHFAIAAAASRPIGLCQDVVNPGDTCKIYLFGKGETKIGQGSGAINALDLIVPDAAGQLKTLPAAAGTYWCVGQAITACAGAGEQFEINDCFPFQVTVT